jgi:putative spermidine/putrescine transport system permease protein
VSAGQSPADTSAPGGLLARCARFFDRHPRLRLATFLSGPAAWLIVAYLGSLLLMLLTSLYGVNKFTQKTDRTHLTAGNYRDLVSTSGPYLAKIVRTIGVALTVTIVDIALALPLGFFIGKVLSPRWRRIGVIAVLMPLWASYIVKGYAWRTLLDPQGGVLRKTFHATPGFGLGGLIILLAYLWLPYMILPIVAGLERLPDSLLAASADLGGRNWRTFRSVVIPLMVPAIAAGSIFTFSLSLGDYISVGLVGGTTDVIGSVVSRNISTNLPFAAAMAAASIVIVGAYLTGARKLGAFDSL